MPSKEKNKHYQHVIELRKGSRAQPIVPEPQKGTKKSKKDKAIEESKGE